MTGCLEGSCSIQLSYGVKSIKKVGVAGFEPTTSWSQTRRDTGLRYTPKNNGELERAERGDSGSFAASNPIDWDKGTARAPLKPNPTVR